MFRKVTDYWDKQADAIDNACQRLSPMSESARLQAIDEMQRAIERHFAVLDDSLAAQTCWIMVEDLYKSVTVSTYWNENLRLYIAATAGRYSALLSARGITFNFVINNEFEPTTFGMLGPIEVFGRWFNAAGFVYICPQQLARDRMAVDGHPPDAYEQQFQRYAAEGVHAAGRAVAQCHEESRHFVYFDADATTESLEQALSRHGQPGHVVAYRDAPPWPGTTSSVWPPPGIRWPGDGS